MTRIPSSHRLLGFLVLISTALASCGGGSGAATGGEPVVANDSDAAGSDVLAKAAAIQVVADQKTTEVAASVAAEDPASTDSRKDGSGRGGYGAFPGVVQSNLVANRDGFGADIIEPSLRNPWGIAIRPAGAGGHFWLASAGSAQSIQYVGDVGATPLFQDDLKVVATGGPSTGTVFNGGKQFVITQNHANGAITAPARFFFANLSGTITAWTERARSQGGFDRPTDTVIVVDGTGSHSAFSGTALTPQADRLLAADFGAQPAVRVYDGDFVESAPLNNPFRVQGSAPTFEAFNVHTLGSSVFAMYGRHVPPTTRPLPTEGRLAEFDADGKLISRWHGRGLLNFPWGVQKAPEDFGIYSGCLLVGNFGDGTIVAFHPRLRVALDYLRDDRGRQVVIDKLWGLQFGNGESLGEANHLYFAAGPNDETDGLFGKLRANPRTQGYVGNYSMCR